MLCSHLRGRGRGVLRPALSQTLSKGEQHPNKLKFVGMLKGKEPLVKQAFGQHGEFPHLHCRGENIKSKNTLGEIMFSINSADGVNTTAGGEI